MFSNINLLKNEYDDLCRNPITTIGLTAGLINDYDYRNWKITLISPRDSIFSCTLFSLTINFPEGYPNEPPIICFKTPIYHLNVNSEMPRSPGDCPLGFICLVPLGLWKAGDTIKETIMNVYSLFYYENPLYSFSNERLNEFIRNINLYQSKKIHFNKKYASNPSTISPFNNQPWNFNI